MRLGIDDGRGIAFFPWQESNAPDLVGVVMNELALGVGEHGPDHAIGEFQDPHHANKCKCCNSSPTACVRDMVVVHFSL
jgi:hypothetical protein